MEIRKTTLQDVDTVLDVFAAAKRYMRANGNASQWGDEYPDRSIVTYDIACGSSYVMLENGEIVGTFALFLGEDEIAKEQVTVKDMTSGEQMTDALNVVYDCVIAKGLAERSRGKVIVEK